MLNCSKCSAQRPPETKQELKKKSQEHPQFLLFGLLWLFVKFHLDKQTNKSRKNSLWLRRWKNTETLGLRHQTSQLGGGHINMQSCKTPASVTLLPPTPSYIQIAPSANSIYFIAGQLLQALQEKQMKKINNSRVAHLHVQDPPSSESMRGAQ